MRAPSSFHSTDEARPSAERVVDRLGRRGQHRLHRLEHREADRLEPGPSLGQRHPTRAADVAAQHHRPPHHGGRHGRGLGDGVGHHALERALAQLAHQQPAQERGLGRAWPGRTVAPRVSARAATDPGPLVAASRVMASSTSSDLERVAAALGGLGDGRHRRPPDADAALAAAPPPGTRPPARPRRAAGRAAARRWPTAWPCGSSWPPPRRRPTPVQRGAWPQSPPLPSSEGPSSRIPQARPSDASPLRSEGRAGG